MKLVECSRIHGGTRLLPGRPREDEFYDILYVPMGVAGHQPGLYDYTRKLVPGSAHVLGVPQPHYKLGSPFTELNHDDFEYYDGPELTYVGYLATHHFGHFTLSGVSKFWPPHQSRNGKFLYIDTVSPDKLLRIDATRELIGHIGLSVSDFIRFDKPTRLKRVVVRPASFEENNCVYEYYRDITNGIGQAVLKQADSSLADRFRGKTIYLTKEKLHRGVSKIVNENEFTSRLRDLGMAIVSPEELSFTEQVAIFAYADHVVGFIGSAFHTSAFAKGRRLFIINHSDLVWSNQILIDKVNHNHTVFRTFIPAIDRIGGDANFGNRFQIQDPIAAANLFAAAHKEIVASDR